MNNIKKRYSMTFFPRLPDATPASARHTQAVGDNQLWPAAKVLPASPALRPLHTHHVPKRPSLWSALKSRSTPISGKLSGASSPSSSRSGSVYGDAAEAPPLSPAVAQLHSVQTRDARASTEELGMDFPPSNPASHVSTPSTAPMRPMFERIGSEDEL